MSFRFGEMKLSSFTDLQVIWTESKSKIYLVTVIYKWKVYRKRFQRSLGRFLKFVQNSKDFI